MDKIRVLLADDHYIVRNGIRTLIEGNEDMEVVGEASDGIEALEKVKNYSPDVLVMDISMPKLNGLDAAELVNKQYPQTKTLILSIYDNDDYVLKAIEVGALGYLLKDTSRDELLKAVRTVALGEKYFSGTVSSIIVNGYLHKARMPESINSSKLKLSKKEKEVLKLIIQGMNSREIAEKLALSVRTIDNHRANMMKRVGVRNAAELVKLAIEKKLV